WFGLVAPAGIPQPVLQRLNAAANQALRQPALRERLAQLGVTPLGGSAQDLEQMVVNTTAQVRALVHRRGITDGS
ncbi:tripartite tricarboxylate transporter substrate-binding protein, partial [Comamonas sp.]